MKTFFCFVLVSLGLVQGGFADEGFTRSSIETFSDHRIEASFRRAESPRAIIFLHGARDEGLNSIAPDKMESWSQQQCTLAALSMPGFGASTGEKDFCGPFTIESLSLAIDHLKKELNISELAIVGFGQGGMAAVLLATKRSDLCGVVCSNGGYDLLRHRGESDPLLERLVAKGYHIDIHSEEALMVRSPLHHVAEIQAPIFLLHRAGNPIVSEVEVGEFYEAMQTHGKKCHVVMKYKTPEADEMKLSYDEILSELGSWLDDQMATPSE